MFLADLRACDGSYRHVFHINVTDNGHRFLRLGLEGMASSLYGLTDARMGPGWLDEHGGKSSGLLRGG